MFQASEKVINANKPLPYIDPNRNVINYETVTTIF